MIKPTVGRKVWYRPAEFDTLGPGAMQVTADQPLDATVLAVWGDRCVNVLVLDIMGKPFTKTSIRLLQDDDKPDVDVAGDLMTGYCEWMPYQQGQAKAVAPPPLIASNPSTEEVAALKEALMKEYPQHWIPNTGLRGDDVVLLSASGLSQAKASSLPSLEEEMEKAGKAGNA